jgi:hypothetical protein
MEYYPPCMVAALGYFVDIYDLLIQHYQDPR